MGRKCYLRYKEVEFKTIDEVFVLNNDILSECNYLKSLKRKIIVKYCSRPFEYIYLDTFEGEVYLCPWMDGVTTGSIGNLLILDFDEIWNGEKAEKLRDIFRRGDFRYCRPQACPRVQNNELPEICNQDVIENFVKTSDRPKYINLAYDFVCNQSCETCRKEVFIPPEGYKEKCEIIRKKITPYINTAEYLSASGHGDPFASHYMMDLLSNLRPQNKNMKIVLETNGVFFDEEHWEKIKHLGEINLNIILTSNSFNEYTYNLISRGGKYEKLMENLKFIKSLRENGAINEYVSSFVIQDRNFREMPKFVDRSLNEFGFDRVVFKPVYQWGTMDEKVFWFKDILNPAHPYHYEYLKILEHPLMNDKRVYNFAGKTVHPNRDFKIIEDNVNMQPLHIGRKAQFVSGMKLCVSAVLGNKTIKKLKYLKEKLS